MFDFENLIAYKKAKLFNQIVWMILTTPNLDVAIKKQLRRAALSVVLNIAEGSGRFTKPDRRNFFVISRSSIFECMAIIDLLNESQTIDKELYKDAYGLGEEISKMLFALISNHSKEGEPRE